MDAESRRNHEAASNLLTDVINPLFGQQGFGFVCLSILQQIVDFLDQRRVILNTYNPLIHKPLNNVAAQAYLDGIIWKGCPAQRTLRVPLDVDNRLIELRFPLSVIGLNRWLRRGQNSERKRLFPSLACNTHRQRIFLAGFLSPVAAFHQP